MKLTILLSAVIVAVVFALQPATAVDDAPDANVTLNSPQLEMWGAMVAGGVTVKSQFSWHYDESETSVTTGRYSIKNWHEVGL